LWLFAPYLFKIAHALINPDSKLSFGFLFVNGIVLPQSLLCFEQVNALATKATFLFQNKDRKKTKKTVACQHHPHSFYPTP